MIAGEKARARPVWSVAGLTIDSVTAVVIAAFAVGAFLRLYNLDARGFWGDEINSLDGASIGIPAIFNGRFGYIANQTSLHYLIVLLTATISDPVKSAVIVRLPSAIAGALTIPLVYLLGREMFSRGVGALAALLAALSAVLLPYSQELRLYSPLVFLSCLSVYALKVAERTGEARWWAAFAVATALNLANAYVALTLFMPVLGLYLAWLLWRLWRGRRESPHRFRRGLTASIVVAAVAVLMYLDMLGAPRVSPDLSRFDAGAIVSAVVELLSWFTRFGLPPEFERPIQLVFLLLAVLGFYVAVRRRGAAASGSVLCVLLATLPPIALAVLGTTNVVFQRYALFSLPFYFLLISSALVALVDAARQRAWAFRAAASVPVLLVLALFAVGALNYSSPDSRHLALSYRPDFRGAAAYLSRVARPQDTIVFIDDPALGYTIAGYYWRDRPPTATYDARDPRLFAHELKGDLYWVVSAEDLSVLSRIVAPPYRWDETLVLERVVILKETAPKDGILNRMDRMVSVLEVLKPGYQHTITFRGSVYQAKGDVAKAVETYRRAGTYFPVGDDYLRAGKGYEARGDDFKAWREAFISKFWQPDLPGVHEWLAQKLKATGFEKESEQETAIADALRQASK